MHSGGAAVFEDAHQVPPGSCLQAELCVIGGGPVAIALAWQLGRAGRDVILLPGAGPQEREEDRERYRGLVEPPGSHEPLEENRRRVWGGTGTAWGGRCVPYDPIDFENRSWIPHSGWPISQAEAEQHLGEALEFCEAGLDDFDAATVFPQAPREILPGFDNVFWSSRNLERWSPPTDFAKRHQAEFQRSRHIRVLLHGQATHLQLDRDGGRMEEVTAASRPDQRFRVKAKAYILACGGLENPRLLLASRDVHEEGIGNRHDQVGRYYQSHLFGVCGQAVLREPKKMVYDFERDPDGVYCRRRFWLTTEAQKKWQTGNVIGFFFRPLSGSALHRDAATSAVFLVKNVLRASASGAGGLIRLWKERGEELQDHAKLVWSEASNVVPRLFRLSVERFFRRRRLPFFLPAIEQGNFPLFFQAEHTPNPESRVLLSPEKVDDLGMPRLVVHIRFSEKDFQTVRVFHQEFRQRLETAGLGSFLYDEASLSAQLEKRSGGFNSNAHHIGTTRMSAEPGSGVVDAEGRVHGLANLYVSGASIFPTSGHANPTLLAISMAFRLAQRLIRNLS